jgi:putative ABC transport system permease protein
MYFLGFVLKNLARRPVRTALTVLGLAVAVGSTVALLGVSDNVSRAVRQSFDRRGIDIVVTAAGKADQLNSDFSEELVDEARRLPGVRDVAAAIVELVEMTRESGASTNVLVQGWAPDNFAFEDLTILSGRKFEPGDSGKVMIGETFAQNTGKGVGDALTIQGERFEVIGVFRSFVVFENGAPTLLLADAQRMTGRTGRVTGFSVRVDKSAGDPAAAVDAVRERIAQLKDPDDPTVRLAAQTTQQYMDTVVHLKIVRAMAWMVSAIGLAIGVISMVNTMAMSVLERTHEIGILRAVGWPRRRVVRMVLGEAVTLALIAAAVGTVGAIAATHLLALSPKVNGFIEGGIAPAVALQGVTVAALLGLVGGAYPAIRAARLLPTEAIRHD